MFAAGRVRWEDLRMAKYWKVPANNSYNYALDMLNQPHLLIAGATGSGKSVLLNSLIYTALRWTPDQAQFVLVDPKRVELVQYAKLPHVVEYASEVDDCISALANVAAIMDARFEVMSRSGQRETTAPHLYVIVDEYAPLIISAKKRVEPLLMRIAMLGRAAHIHLILCTQRPTRDIITGAVKVNIDARVALRCPTAQDSRNIIGSNDAATLPAYGQAYYLTPQTMTPELIDVQRIDPAEIDRVVKAWLPQKHALKTRLRWWAEGFLKTLLSA